MANTETRFVRHRGQGYLGKMLGTTRLKKLFEDPVSAEEIRVELPDGAVKIASPARLEPATWEEFLTELHRLSLARRGIEASGVRAEDIPPDPGYVACRECRRRLDPTIRLVCNRCRRRLCSCGACDCGREPVAHRPAKLVYHAPAFDLLDETPFVLEESVNLIVAWEKRHQRPMPPSVREWYSLAGADVRFNVPQLEYSQDPLVRMLDPEDERRWAAYLEGIVDPELSPSLFVYNIRGEINFFVHLDDNDDPKMFQDCPDEWSITFSAFVLGTIEQITDLETDLEEE
jgi:hypothetical protein